MKETLLKKNDPHLDEDGLVLLIDEVQKDVLSDLHKNRFKFKVEKRMTKNNHISDLLGIKLTTFSTFISGLTSNAILLNFTKSDNKFRDYILEEYYTKEAINNPLFFVGSCYMTNSKKFWKELFVNSVFLRINVPEQDKVFFYLKEHRFSKNEIIILMYQDYLILNLEKTLDLPSFPLWRKEL